MGSKAILKNRNYVLEKIIKDNKNIEDILLHANFTKQKLVEAGVIDTKAIDNIILEIQKSDIDILNIEENLDVLDALIDNL